MQIPTNKVIAVDFDGTLCQFAWPNIGEPNIGVIQFFRRLRACGNKLILWTCREGKMLDAAVAWCKEHDLEFDAVNANLPERIAQYNNDSRKVGADLYCDDSMYDSWKCFLTI